MNTPNGEVRLRLRLRDIMKERGLTQLRVSEMSGVSRIGIINLVRSPLGIKLCTIQALCDALEITPAELFEYEKPGG